MRRLTAGLVVGLILVGGCHTSTPAQHPSPSRPSCPATINGNEVRGQAPPGGDLWALLFSSYPVPQRTEVKIVWRMTGQGDLTLEATGPDGQHLAPKWGPEAHSSSTWNKPGSEWGTGFIFPTSGCWAISLQRGNDHATAAFLVDS